MNVFTGYFDVTLEPVTPGSVTNTAQTVVGLTLDKETGQPAFVSIGYASTDVTVDAETGAVSINADAKPVVTITVINSTNPATSQAVGGASVDARVQKSTDSASPNAVGQITPSATFSKSASPAISQSTGGPLGQSTVEGTLGSVSVISQGSAPLAAAFTLTTTSPVMNALLESAISAASIKALSSLIHNAVGAAVVTSSVVTQTQAAEIESMLYRVFRRILMTPRTLRASTEKPMADYTPTYS